MIKLLGLLVLGILIGYGWSVYRSGGGQEASVVKALPTSLYEISINSISGEPLDWTAFKGKSILFVNVASKCGFTPQYEGLEALYGQYKEKGLVVVGIPSNDFGSQEPGTAEEITTFCQTEYGVSFPMTEKANALGAEIHPLLAYLSQSNPDLRGAIKWNFSKFLVDKNGKVVDRFASITKPLSEKIQNAVQENL